MRYEVIVYNTTGDSFKFILESHAEAVELFKLVTKYGKNVESITIRKERI